MIFCTTETVRFSFLFFIENLNSTETDIIDLFLEIKIKVYVRRERVEEMKKIKKAEAKINDRNSMVCH